MLFIIVLEALSRELRKGLPKSNIPIELLYADDLVLVAGTEDLLMEKLWKWKKGIELKGMRVNTGKKKVKRCQVNRGQAVDSKNRPCSVCRRGVVCNSIMCIACHRWVHKRCSGISGRMRNNVDLHCRRCSSQEVVLRKVEIELSVRVECLPKACYLGDIYLVPVVHGEKEAARAKFKDYFLS